MAGADRVRAATSMVSSRVGSATTASSSAWPTSGSTWTGMSPFLVLLSRKMSAKRGEITARKP